MTPPPTPVPGPGRRAKEQTRSNGFPGSRPPPLFSCPVAFVRRERRLSNAGLGRWPPLLPAREPERLHVRADDRPRSSKIVCYESARSFEAAASRRSLAHRLIRRLLCTSAKLSSALRQSSSCNVFCTYVKPIVCYELRIRSSASRWKSWASAKSSSALRSSRLHSAVSRRLQRRRNGRLLYGANASAGLS